MSEPRMLGHELNAGFLEHKKHNDGSQSTVVGRSLPRCIALRMPRHSTDDMYMMSSTVFSQRCYVPRFSPADLICSSQSYASNFESKVTPAAMAASVSS